MPESLSPENLGLTREQKTGFFLLLAFGIMAVTLGFLQIRNTLYGPLALNNEIPVTVRREVVDDVDTLRYRDTDRDGLFDFDELYVVGTSPYLTDTDSDGITDKQEVDTQSNPLCPQGRDCSQFIVSESNAAISTTTPARAIGLPVEDPGAPPPDLNQALRDPAQIRAMLLQAGMSKAALDKVSDKDLLRTVEEILSVQASSTFTAGATTTAPRRNR